MDAATATIVGFLLGGLMAWGISVFQRREDRRARALERKYERLHTASRLLRISVIQAARLHYTRSWWSILDVTAFPSLQWPAFGQTLAEIGASLALVLDDISGPVATEFEEAAEAIFGSRRADQAKLTRFTNAALALRRKVEAKARGLR